MAEPNEEVIYEPPPASNVVPLFLATIAPMRREAPATEDELAEFRKYWPQMKQMLREWEIAKSPKQGCPILANVLAPPLTK